MVTVVPLVIFKPLLRVISFSFVVNMKDGNADDLSNKFTVPVALSLLPCSY